MLSELKANFAQLVAATVEHASVTGRELRRLRGIAFFDSEKDALTTSLAPYAAVEDGIKALPLVAERYGSNQAPRLALQLVYEYFERTKSESLDSQALDSVWVDFVAELESPVGVTRCVTNLRNFQCADLLVDLGDGVSIGGRSPQALSGLGFSSAIIDNLFAQWGGFSASSFVLVAEYSEPKRPDALLMVDSQATWMRCARAIGAMRLIAPGDVGMSTVYFQRVARFNVGIGGVHSNGSTMDTIGSPLAWLPEHQARYSATYSALAHLEKSGYSRAPGNLDLALRAFMSTFDRFPTAPDTKLVDSITALEAVLVDNAELSFKLAFRVASLLAATDNERAALLKQMRGYYDARSKVVHGDHVKAKQLAALQSDDELRDQVRRLLRGMVHFAASPVQGAAAKLFTDGHLDAALVHSEHREQLRRALGLAE